jgi:hypothetical protein
MLFNIAPTFVFSPSTEPVLQKILKGDNFSSYFSMSAAHKSFLYLSLPSLSLPFDLKDLKDTTLKFLSRIVFSSILTSIIHHQTILLLLPNNLHHKFHKVQDDGQEYLLL